MKPRMLIVEDSEVAALALHEFFIAEGYEVRLAVTTSHSHRLLAEDAYAVILTDLSLGDAANTDGIGIIRAARQRHPASAIVLLSALASDALASEAMAAGADVVLGKRIRLETLAGVIRDLLARPHDRRRRPF